MSEKFTCKTNKDGEFSVSKDKDVPTNPFNGKLFAQKVSLKGKLAKPAKITIEGALNFNGSKKAFKRRTGEVQDFGTFALKAKNTIELTGKAMVDGKDPARAGTELTFEVDSETE